MNWYIKLHRSLLDHPILSNTALFGFFCYILLKVNHKKTCFFLWQQKIFLEAGQAIISQKKLASQFRVSISTINRRLKTLWREWITETQGRAKYTLVTVVNRSVYQASGKLAETYKKDNNYNSNNHFSLSVSTMIESLKAEAGTHGVVYNPRDEVEFAHLLTSDDWFSRLAENNWKTINEMAQEILRMSVHIKFRKWVCSWPKLIYENYAEIYNKWKDMIFDDVDDFIRSQHIELQKKLLTIKKMRAIKYPYKKPFNNIEHLKSFISAIQKWHL